MSKFTVGVDIGGTNIKLGLVNSSGKIISQTRFETKSFASSKMKLIDALVDSIQTLISKNKLTLKNIQGIGIGLPGLIDPVKGVVKQLPNISGWTNVPLVALLKKKLSVPIFIDNDVNLITLAEWKFGAGRGCRDLLCITLGTGVGGGFIFENKLYRGPGYVAGEIGHMPIKENGIECPCGGRGCFERYVGNAYLTQKFQTIFKNNAMRTQDVYQLAEQGNARALQFWHEVGTTVGQGLIGVINLINPKMVVIGGGVSNNYKFFAPAMKDLIKKRCMKVQGSMVRIVRARFSHQAGILGAHVLVSEGI